MAFLMWKKILFFAIQQTIPVQYFEWGHACFRHLRHFSKDHYAGQDSE